MTSLGEEGVNARSPGSRRAVRVNPARPWCRRSRLYHGPGGTRAHRHGRATHDSWTTTSLGCSNAHASSARPLNAHEAQAIAASGLAQSHGNPMVSVNA